MERAGRLIPKLKLSPEMADPEARARAAWKLAAGPNIARHTRAAALVRSTLIVEVEDFTWQQNIARYERDLLRNLREALGESIVESLDFRPMRKPAASEAGVLERRGPMRAHSARSHEDSGAIAASAGASSHPNFERTRPDADRVQDPVLDWLYRQSKAK